MTTTRPRRRADHQEAAGDAAEDRALAHLRRAGLRLVARNYRTPGRGGGEIDLMMIRDGGTLVFVEVRQRATARTAARRQHHGAMKQRRIVFAARHFLLRLPSPPPCRFDVVLVEEGINGCQAAFDAAELFPAGTPPC
jgi:putative endonuclease